MTISLVGCVQGIGVQSNLCTYQVVNSKGIGYMYNEQH